MCVLETKPRLSSRATRALTIKLSPQRLVFKTIFYNFISQFYWQSLYALKIIFLLQIIIYVFLHVYLCVMYMQNPKAARSGTGFPGAGL